MKKKMATWEVCQFCTEQGHKFMPLFGEAVKDYRSDTVDKQTYINCVKELQNLWDKVMGLTVCDHLITARQLINWFFIADGCVTLDYEDFLVYERMYLIMLLNRGVSLSVILDSILSTKYSSEKTWHEVAEL